MSSPLDPKSTIPLLELEITQLMKNYFLCYLMLKPVFQKPILFVRSDFFRGLYAIISTTLHKARRKESRKKTYLWETKKKCKLISLLKFCSVVQTNMNSRYHSIKILTCSLKATWIFKLRHYLQSNSRLCLHQLMRNNHKLKPW